MVPWAYTNGTIGRVINRTNIEISKCCMSNLACVHGSTNGTIGRADGTIGITISTNGITNGTIGRTLNDIGIPLVPLVES